MEGKCSQQSPFLNRCPTTDAFYLCAVGFQELSFLLLDYCYETLLLGDLFFLEANGLQAFGEFKKWRMEHLAVMQLVMTHHVY